MPSPRSSPRTWCCTARSATSQSAAAGAVLEAIQGIGGSADLQYTEVLTGQIHHAANFRLQIDDTVVDGMDRFLLDADGKIAEVTIWWRPLPSGVQMQRHLAGLLGMQPWELRTDG